MSETFRAIVVTCLLSVGLGLYHHASTDPSNKATQREVAVTFDDLPVVGTRDIAAQQQITRNLLHSITAHKVPAIGFVNENKLLDDGVQDKRRVTLLQQWLDAGLDLGNHSFSHPDLHQIPLEAFLTDVVRGEEVTRRLLEKRGSNLRYFRHPFLHVGRDLETQRKLEAFLTSRGCRVAPVTIDNSDWIFASAYAKSSDKSDRRMMERIAAAYLPYMEEKFAYYEKQSMDLLGYEIRQVLLLHANALNADWFDELAKMIKRRGYRFIPLKQALEDKAYGSPDTYAGAGGISWLHRWALTQGKEREFFRGEPATPSFVMERAGVTAE
jgi:peptidoglycan/xylan/chitin deacetylase (PgdA/CDA1 family)